MVGSFFSTPLFFSGLNYQNEFIKDNFKIYYDTITLRWIKWVKIEDQTIIGQIAKNPNNPASKATRDNRANQKNPNIPKSQGKSKKNNF